MSKGGAKISWWDEVVGRAGFLLVIGLIGAAIWYLSTAPYDADPPESLDPSSSVMILGLAAIVVLLASGAASDQLNWHGPLRVEVPEGYAWRRSIRSRLSGLGNLGFLVFGHKIVFLPQAAWQNEDWGRLALSSLIIAGFGYIILLAFADALSTRAVLTIDGEGFRGVGVPGKAVRWDSIERLSVGGRLEARELTMYELGKDGGIGPAHTINLAAAGISVRAFLAKVSEFAPQVEVTLPTSRMADFSAA